GLQRARGALEESLTLYRRLGDVRYVAITLTMLGGVVRHLGDTARAAALLREGLDGHWQVGDRSFLMQSLGQLAGLMAGPQPALAARLLGAAEALRHTLGMSLAPVDSP